ncbi:paramyosin, long form [Anopheles arabiensis]|uniref:AGAP004877-PA n=3 Tax=gambiae species complex TaxID=44542 RepID=Q7Q978_ANOGA|nr:paramyosin, long form [Anopheles arabiensis]XP_040223922.1 paramyosin, long form [Anopheles coluzzii]XP_041771500.1 paramyosin, long form [Anopheles merus]XP_314309.4 paramyosin, long form [Anopheles gambiae]EAA09724.4 AGAP004877-PA [Anopheles gambiae str. PEST]
MSSSAVTTKTSKYTYRSTGGGTADVSIEYSADLSALSRLEDKIRLLQEDLESERGLRQRIEREKADLSVQVIQLSERLEEAEGGAEGQLEINRKRDVELTKLRKLLEDVHLESEETAHILKRKHQEIVSDFNEQLEALTKSKQRVEKEKSKLQAEIYELLSQVESISKDKQVSIKTIEKLEVQVTELNIRIEELNRTIVDISSHKTRLSQENIDLVKSVQDLKLSVESISFSKTQLNSQLEEARRRLEEDDRRRSMLESSLHQVETELESIRLQLEEESEARLDLERQLVKANGEAGTFKSKYEAECMARAEEVEEIRRKYTVRITESEEHIESLQARLSKLEKEKSRLTSEIEVLIIDLEKANNGIREYTKRIEILEKTNIEIKTRLEETIALYDASQRDLRQRTADFQRLSHELDKTREQKDQLGRDNNKLQNELHESRSTVTELTRRLHEYEVELRRLENEREELTAAYKEAEAGRKAEEKRAQALSAEYGQFRHDTERRLLEKDEEIEVIRKQTSIEIEQLNARVVEAETKLKSEVQRIKKKLQIQITELEMSLDVANHTNIELQKTIKKQSLQLTEMQAHYEEIQRQLQSTVDQYGIAQRRIQSLSGELEEIRINYDSSLRAKRQVEVSLEEATTRINELSVVNANYASLKAKLETELQTLAVDYEEVTRELRVSDERYQKIQVELKHTVELLHEEQERIVKIEAIKKSLEVEVKQLSVRLEEVEVNAVAGSRRIINKLEARLRDIEVELDEERRKHAETIKILRKKERSVKEVYIQIEEDQKNIQILQDALEKANQKIAAYKRQLTEQEQSSQQCVTKVRRFQRELEAAEDRADVAESNLSLVRAKHRTFVTTSTVPGSQVYLVQETTRTINETSS